MFKDISEEEHSSPHQVTMRHQQPQEQQENVSQVKNNLLKSFRGESEMN